MTALIDSRMPSPIRGSSSPARWRFIQFDLEQVEQQARRGGGGGGEHQRPALRHLLQQAAVLEPRQRWPTPYQPGSITRAL